MAGLGLHLSDCTCNGLYLHRAATDATCKALLFLSHKIKIQKQKLNEKYEMNIEWINGTHSPSIFQINFQQCHYHDSYTYNIRRNAISYKKAYYQNKMYLVVRVNIGKEMMREKVDTLIESI